MKLVFFSLLLSFLFIGCATTQKLNKWEYESAVAYDSYRKKFLSGREQIANIDLNRAIEHAKSGQNFNALATIYLGECALHVSIGELDTCQNYLDVKHLTSDAALEPYYNFITGTLKKEQILLLPNIYQNYVWHVRYHEYAKAQQDIATMTKMSSKFLAAALMKEHLDTKTRERMIELSSFYGYKKVTLFWLEESKKWTKTKNELELLDKRISLLKQKD